MNQLTNALLVSGILSLVTLAAVFTFRYAAFPDLSVDSVFTLGAATVARSLVAGMALPFAFGTAILAGALAGMLTATMAEKLRINALLASVLTLIILYSANLRIMGGPNLAAFALRGGMAEYLPALITVLVSGIYLIVFIVLKTQLGATIRATGQFASFLEGVGRDPAIYRTVIVAFGGALVATSGAVFMLFLGFADASMGMGVLIIAIASLIAGEKLTGRRHVGSQLAAALIGIVIYEAASAAALSAGVEPVDVKLLTGIITILLLSLRRGSMDNVLA